MTYKRIMTLMPTCERSRLVYGLARRLSGIGTPPLHTHTHTQVPQTIVTKSTRGSNDIIPSVVQYRFVFGEFRVASGLGVCMLPAVAVALHSRFAGHGRPRMVRSSLEPEGDVAQHHQQQQQRSGRPRPVHPLARAAATGRSRPACTPFTVIIIFFFFRFYSPPYVVPSVPTRAYRYPLKGIWPDRPRARFPRDRCARSAFARVRRAAIRPVRRAAY